MRGGLRLGDWFRRWPLGLRSLVAQGTVLAALLVVLAVLYREPLADRLWPETRAQALRAAAAAALARGHLSAADGSGARELYAAALALDPDRGDARAGLQRVGEAALARARQHLRAQAFDDARRDLRLARALAVPRAEADAVATLLREREADVAGIDALLARADRARAEGEPVAALRLYRRVLSLQPARTEALEGREDLLADLLQRARGHVARGQLREAATLVAQVAAFDAGHVDLPEARSLLARGVDARHAVAERALRRGRLATATENWREVLAADPGHEGARAGLARLADAHAARAVRFSADFRFEAAERELAAARALSPEAAAVREAAGRLAQARRSRAQLPRPGSDAARVRELLARAAAAEERGDLLQPPGESAYDFLRRARALAPRDPGVEASTTRLLSAARACFERELTGNRLGRAHGYLDARQQLGDARDVAADRRRLAERWVAIGSERLGAGELELARRAEQSALALDPDATGLAALRERLRAAAAAR